MDFASIAFYHLSRSGEIVGCFLHRTQELDVRRFVLLCSPNFVLPKRLQMNAVLVSLEAWMRVELPR